MASGSKTTAVHFTLIFFVMLSVILGVVSYMFYDEQKELRTKAEQSGKNETLSKNAQIKSQKELDVLKKKTGYIQSDVGELSNPEDGTASKAIDDDIKKYGGSQAQPNLTATIQKLSQQLDVLIKERDAKITDLQRQTTQMASQRNQYDVSVKNQEAAVKTAETGRALAQTSKEEAINAKNQEISTLRVNINKAQTDIETLRTEKQDITNELNGKIERLIAINIHLNEKLDKIERVSFEKQDGLIRWVDNVNRIVWINLGEVDKLPVRTTFSIYSKNNEGIGRGTHDIKGSCEVTRILGPHLAECKIVKDDIYKPITNGDPIYTPLWSPGVKERFSFVGLIDLDGDGKYELDRKQLHQIVSAASAEIGGEVIDNGEFEGNDIDVHTKFLVVGHIPKPDDAGDPETQEEYQTIREQLKKMKDQAREQGVRVVTLKDFVLYMGYTPSRRLWLPGEDVPWLLKSGSHSTAVNQTVGKRQSSGQTAGVYSRSKRLKQPKSTGRTSQLYK